MAYAALVSLQQTIDMILNHAKYSISVDEREQITSIFEYICFLISFLENFPEKAQHFERKVRELANEAEDLIEYFFYKQFWMNYWCSVGLSRVEYERRLKKVREEIGTITGDMMDDRPCDVHAPISSSSLVASGKNDVVVGLNDDLIAIKERLCGQSSKLEVIPIVGMGGIGKTTLARYAFDDSLIMEFFHIRAFVQVSQDYSVKKILLNLVASIKLFEEQMIGEMKECELAEQVYKILKGRKYLIVMDDIWSADAWDDFRNIFPDDKNGSRIMLTTRLSDAAAYASSGSPVHENPAFPRTLKKLTLVRGQLPWEDMGIIGSLPNLQVLKLKHSACDGDTWKTTNGEFRQLKFLQIKRSKLRYWITESLHFPRLECPYLKEIPKSVGEIPTLELIQVDVMNEALANSAKQIQEDQHSTYGNDAFQVRRVYV